MLEFSLIQSELFKYGIEHDHNLYKVNLNDELKYKAAKVMTNNGAMHLV